MFRNGEQALEKRCKWDQISLEESPVYSRFKKGAPKKIVFIGDTNNMPSIEDAFRERAAECGYRTVIAFPLRLPAPIGLSQNQAVARTGEFIVAKLLGFFSIDAEEVGAFEGLLRTRDGNANCRDDDREPRDDLDVFYGVADSLATILVLTSAPSNSAATGEGR